MEDDGVWFSEIGGRAGLGVAFRVAPEVDVGLLGECVGFVMEEWRARKRVCSAILGERRGNCQPRGEFMDRAG